MIVTTSQKVHPMVAEQAETIAHHLELPYIPRLDRSVQAMHQLYGVDILVVTRRDIKWYRAGNDLPFFFHPGLSVVRIKRLIRGDNDIMIETSQLQPGDSFLDCTLGLAADAIVASFVVGEHGRVVGLESEPLLAYLVADGLKQVQEFPAINEAAKRIEVWPGQHMDHLQKLPDKSFDVVYFDPMFRQGIKHSSSLETLRGFANPRQLCGEVIDHAKRIARKRVVLKEHKYSGEFERLGFSPIRRESMDVTYGVIDV